MICKVNVNAILIPVRRITPLSARSIRIWINFSAVMFNSHLSAPLSLNFSSTVEIRCELECLSVQKRGGLAYKWLICNSNISCEDTNTIHLCCKFILKVGFWKILNFNLFLEIYERYSSRESMTFFQSFLIYISPFWFLPAPETKPKQHIMMTNYNKSCKDFEVFHNFYFILKTFRVQTYVKSHTFTL